MPKKDIPYLSAVGDKAKIKYKDVFDLEEFYKALHEWLMEHGWRDPEEGGDHWESFYGERIGQGGVREIWIQWRLTKPLNDAPKLQYYLDIDFHVLGLKSTEVIKGGQKIKAHKGEVEIIIKPLIQEKYKGELEKSSILRQFLTFFQNKVYGQTVSERKKELYHETYEFLNFIKQWFKLKRYLPYEENKSFFPSYAWPSHLKEE